MHKQFLHSREHHLSNGANSTSFHFLRISFTPFHRNICVLSFSSKITTNFVCNVIIVKNIVIRSAKIRQENPYGIRIIISVPYHNAFCLNWIHFAFAITRSGTHICVHRSRQGARCTRRIWNESFNSSPVPANAHVLHMLVSAVTLQHRKNLLVYRCPRKCLSMPHFV